MLPFDPFILLDLLWARETESVSAVQSEAGGPFQRGELRKSNSSVRHQTGFWVGGYFSQAVPSNNAVLLLRAIECSSASGARHHLASGFSSITSLL